MKINTLGVVLSYYGKKEKLSLDKICSGICSVPTLQRIERGERIADSLMGELLLERIGKEVAQFELLLNDEDYGLWRMREQIKKEQQQKEYIFLQQHIEEYRLAQKEYAELHEQFCLYHETIMTVALEKENHKKICCLAREALALTGVKLGREKIAEKRLYTQTEIELILLLIQHGYIEEDELAESELLSLFDYVEHFYTERRKEKMGIVIIAELIALEQRRKENTMALFYINKGIDFLSQGRGISGLENLHFLKAQVLADKYDSDFGQTVEKQEIQREYLMAYCICEVMGYMEMMREIEKFGEERLSWLITELEM